MSRGLVAAAMLANVLVAVPARAADPAPAAPATAQLQQLLGTLQDDQARAKLIDQIKALIAAQQAAATATDSSAAPSAAAPGDAPAGGLVEGLARHFDAIAAEIADSVGIAQAAPGFVAWIEDQFASPQIRAQWLATILQLVAVFALAVLARFAAQAALRGWRLRFAARNGSRFATRIFLFLFLLALEAAPTLIFAAVATLALAVLHPGAPAQPVATVAIEAVLYAQLILTLLHVVLISRGTAFFHLGEESRTYLYIWARRLIFTALYGFALAQACWWLGVPGAIYALLLRGTSLTLGALAIVFVLQNRATVAEFLRGAPTAAASPPAGSGGFRLMRLALADTWHVFAIVYILGSFGSFIVNIQGGFVFVLRGTIVTVLVLLFSIVAMRFVHRVGAHGFALGHDVKTRFPGIEARANRYLPALIALASLAVYAVAILFLLQAWGFAGFAWLDSAFVRQAASLALSIGIVVLVAVFVWELISAGIERALDTRSPYRRSQVSARLRTLLPLFRTTVLIALVTVAGFIILSQIGVNIAPLLAGAGIVGIAVGLGSQALVKDLINGLFILIENTITVGDAVDVGNGHAGVVEEISIRSMRLRDGDGALHTIPFSAVTTITNSNRGVGNASVSVAVAAGEDIARVEETLRAIASEMRKDPAFQSRMLGNLDLWGVDKVEGSRVTVVGQIVCTDSGRWPVQREFNRRVKDRFQELGIAFALPAQIVIARESDTAGQRRAPQAAE